MTFFEKVSELEQAGIHVEFEETVVNALEIQAGASPDWPGWRGSVEIPPIVNMSATLTRGAHSVSCYIEETDPNEELFVVALGAFAGRLIETEKLTARHSDLGRLPDHVAAYTIKNAP